MIKAQLEFIRRIKDQLRLASCPIEDFKFTPPYAYRGQGQLEVTKFYVKEVLLMAPHLQFSRNATSCIMCENCQNSNSFRFSQWNEPRLIHGMDQTLYMLQSRYECSVCKATKTASELIKLSTCPDFIKLAYDKLVYLTHNSGFTGIRMHFILCMYFIYFILR